MRYPVPVALLIALCCLAALVLTTPTAAQPTILQNFTTGVTLRCVAVSPTGNQIAIVDTTGLRTYHVKASGQIGDPLSRSLLLTNIARCSFSSNGKWIILACDDGTIWRIERSTWLASSKTSSDGHKASGLSLIEDPAYGFVAYSDNARGTVVRYANSSLPFTSIPAVSGMLYGLWTVPADDGQRIVRGGLGPAGSAGAGVMCCQDNPLVGTQQYWTLTTPNFYQAGCVGPDPDHLLVAETQTHTLHMFKFSDGSGCHGSHALGDSPCDVAFTPDGYYAVVPDSMDCSVTVISGHDLRGILNGQPGLNPDNVRNAKVHVGRTPRGVTVHPSLPIAYVWSTTAQQLYVIKLAIPGIEHP